MFLLLNMFLKRVPVVIFFIVAFLTAFLFFTGKTHSKKNDLKNDLFSSSVMVRNPFINSLEFLCDAEQKIRSLPAIQEKQNERFDSVMDNSTGKTVKVRFLATHTRGKLANDTILYGFLASARLAGVPVEIIGWNWKTFSLLMRHQFISEYIEKEKLNDDDVMMMIDTDILFNGMDLYPLMEKYLANSPSSPEALNARKVRLFQQTAPVLISSEGNCARFEGECKTSQSCESKYNVVEVAMEQWALEEGLSYERNDQRTRNLNRFLNNGLILGRVWAMKKLCFAYHEYAKTVLPAHDEWSADQGIWADLYLNLRYWEIREEQLDLNPKKKINAFGLLPGMIELDYNNIYAGWHHFGMFRFSFVYSGKTFITSMQNMNDDLLMKTRKKILDGNISIGRTASGALFANAFFTLKLSNVSEHEGKIGVPISDGSEPPLWHFPGPDKKIFMPYFYQFLPTRIVLDVYPDEIENTQRVFWKSKKNKVWLVYPDNSSKYALLSLKHEEKNDFSGSEICSLVGNK